MYLERPWQVIDCVRFYLLFVMRLLVAWQEIWELKAPGSTWKDLVHLFPCACLTTRPGLITVPTDPCAFYSEMILLHHFFSIPFCSLSCLCLSNVFVSDSVSFSLLCVCSCICPTSPSTCLHVCVSLDFGVQKSASWPEDVSVSQFHGDDSA